MIIYYSGEGSRSNPEISLQDEARIMLTYHNFKRENKLDKRAKAIWKARRRRNKEQGRDKDAAYPHETYEKRPKK